MAVGGANGAGAGFDEESWRAHFDGVEVANKLRLLDGPAIAAPLPDLEFVCAEMGLVAGGGAPHMIAGYGFSGKTVAAQAMCLALAAGRPIWGVYRAPKTRVVHVDAEQGERLTRRRYQRLARAAGIDLPTLGDDIALTCLSGLMLHESRVADWQTLMSGRGLIVIDSLRAVTGGIDENDSAIRGPLDMLTRLSEQTKCRALVLHHGRKPAEGSSVDDKYAIRGSGAIFDACDTAYVFAAGKGDPVSVRQVKSRSFGEPIDDFAIVINDVAGDGDDPKWGLSVRVHGAELIERRREERVAAEAERRGQHDARRLAAALSKHPGAGSREIRAVTGLGGDRLAAALLVLGDKVNRVEERNGRATTVRHFLRPS